jgi:tRNA threonylcarbamoyladenosine biosynthesis protein TsaE
MNTSLELETHSAEQTIALGRAFAELLPTGAVVALDGDLASGKTTFVKGMAAHFAGGDPVHSPTFTLVNEYGREPRLYHLDLYRLRGPADVADLGYEDVLDAGGISVVEWAGRAAGLLPACRVDIAFGHGGGDKRSIVITDHGVLPPGWQEALTTQS